MSRWFRFYDDAINDPKILRLSDANFRAWVTLLCLASKNEGVLPSTNDIALVLRMKPNKVAEWLAMLTAAGLVDNDKGLFSPHNWDRRQFKSDVSTERVKRFRNGQRNASSDVSETPPETEQITDKKQKTSLRSEARARATRLADDWIPSEIDLAFAVGRSLPIATIETEALKFRNHWTSKSGKDATKTNWSRTWENWILNIRGAPSHGNGTGNSRASGHDAILAVAARKARELDRNDEMAGAARTPGFAFGDGVDTAGSNGGRGAAEADRDDHQRREPDDGRVREGEIIPPDQDAAGFPGRRQLV